MLGMEFSSIVVPILEYKASLENFSMVLWYFYLSWKPNLPILSE